MLACVLFLTEFEKIFKTPGVFFLKNVKGSRRPVVSKFWENLKESRLPTSNVLFLIEFEKISGVSYRWQVLKACRLRSLVFYFWKNLGCRWSLVLETIWKNLDDPLWLVFDTICCFWENLEESWGFLVSVLLLKQFKRISRTPYDLYLTEFDVLESWENLKESWGSLVSVLLLK